MPLVALSPPLPFSHFYATCPTKCDTSTATLLHCTLCVGPNGKRQLGLPVLQALDHLFVKGQEEPKNHLSTGSVILYTIGGKTYTMCSGTIGDTAQATVPTQPKAPNPINDNNAMDEMDKDKVAEEPPNYLDKLNNIARGLSQTPTPSKIGEEDPLPSAEPMDEAWDTALNQAQMEEEDTNIWNNPEALEDFLAVCDPSPQLPPVMQLSPTTRCTADGGTMTIILDCSTTNLPSHPAHPFPPTGSGNPSCMVSNAAVGTTSAGTSCTASTAAVTCLSSTTTAHTATTATPHTSITTRTSSATLTTSTALPHTAGTAAMSHPSPAPLGMRSIHCTTSGSSVFSEMGSVPSHTPMPPNNCESTALSGTLLTPQTLSASSNTVPVPTASNTGGRMYTPSCSVPSGNAGNANTGTSHNPAPPHGGGGTGPGAGHSGSGGGGAGGGGGGGGGPSGSNVHGPSVRKAPGPKGPAPFLDDGQLPVITFDFNCIIYDIDLSGHAQSRAMQTWTSEKVLNFGQAMEAICNVPMPWMHVLTNGLDGTGLDCYPKQEELNNHGCHMMHMNVFQPMLWKLHCQLTVAEHLIGPMGLLLLMGHWDNGLHNAKRVNIYIGCKHWTFAEEMDAFRSMEQVFWHLMQLHALNFDAKSAAFRAAGNQASVSHLKKGFLLEGQRPSDYVKAGSDLDPRTDLNSIVPGEKHPHGDWGSVPEDEATLSPSSGKGKEVDRSGSNAVTAPLHLGGFLPQTPTPVGGLGSAAMLIDSSPVFDPQTGQHIVCQLGGGYGIAQSPVHGPWCLLDLQIPKMLAICRKRSIDSIAMSSGKLVKLCNVYWHEHPGKWYTLLSDWLGEHYKTIVAKMFECKAISEENLHWSNCKAITAVNKQRYNEAEQLLDAAEDALLEALQDIHHCTGMSIANATHSLVAEEARARGNAFNLSNPATIALMAAKQRELEENSSAWEAAEVRLCELREQCQTQPRVDYRHQQQDTIQAADSFHAQVSAFSSQTGGHACGFIVRGDIKDYAKPVFYGDELSACFFREVLRIEPLAVAQNLEVFCTNGGAQELITNNPARTMSYKWFSQDIEAHYSITLQCWPLPSLQNPSEVLNLANLSNICNALDSVQCFFRHMTQEEIQRRKIAKEQEQVQPQEKQEAAKSQATSPHRLKKRPYTMPNAPIDPNKVAMPNVLPVAFRTSLPNLTGRLPNSNFERPAKKQRIELVPAIRAATKAE
ncbi:hypothetical protein CALCODRAFT_506054 [Calocera cornea HHB12733]|uniref:Uncharacterized protein n=1 Tax=Calocera cornea HHB12733 TaxID=1353952 RepID=A0A165JE12_9BASI|nr:hypothetical protein CALCODRAFT_506054 [Calocera cornea HHB12733]